MFTRLYNLIRGRLNLIFSRMEERNPDVLLENAKSDLLRIRAQMQNGVRDIATISATLRRQVAEGEVKKKDLEGRAMVAYQAGNMEIAQELAVMLEDVSRELDTNKQELETNETHFNEFRTMCNTQEKEAQDKLRRYSQMISKAKAKTAMAEVTELLSGSVSQMSAASTNMDRLKEVTEGSLDKAEGRIRAATSNTAFAEVKIKQAEQDMRKQSALANLLASKGVKAAPTTAAPVASPAAPVVQTPATPTLS